MEIRNPNIEIRDNNQNSNAQNKIVLNIRTLKNSDLFRASNFALRI